MKKYICLIAFFGLISCLADGTTEEKEEVVIESLDDLLSHTIDTMPAQLELKGKCPEVLDTIKYPLPDFADDSLKSLKWTIYKPITSGSSKLAEKQQRYFAFNENLQLTSQFEIVDGDTLTILNKYYNENDLVKSTERMDFSTDINEICQFFYYDQCNLLKLKLNENLEQLTAYYYDKRGRLRETITVKMEDLSERRTVVFKYKPKSNFVTEEMVYLNDEFVELRTYEESENGNQIRETIDGENVFKEFDSYGNVKFKKIQWGPLTEYFYTYDDHTNWIERKEVEEGVLKSVEKREIVYYEVEPAIQ